METPQKAEGRLNDHTQGSRSSQLTKESKRIKPIFISSYHRLISPSQQHPASPLSFHHFSLFQLRPSPKRTKKPILRTHKGLGGREKPLRGVFLCFAQQISTLRWGIEPVTFVFLSKKGMYEAVTEPLLRVLHHTLLLFWKLELSNIYHLFLGMGQTIGFEEHKCIVMVATSSGLDCPESYITLGLAIGGGIEMHPVRSNASRVVGSRQLSKPGETTCDRVSSTADQGILSQ